MGKILCFHLIDEPNGYLSNWYPSPFTMDGICYASVEQYMMHQKTVTFGDSETAAAILATDDPGKIKALGRSVRNYSDPIWNGIRQIVVYRGLLEKFRQNAELKRQLLATHPHILAECALRDNIWGIGMTMHDEYRFHPDLWQGQNLLGFTLMMVRQELAQEQ